MRPMNSPKGVPTSAVYGFMNVLLKIKEDYNPDYLAVAFDYNAKTFRHEKFEDYKAGREKMPEDLVIQLNTLKDLLASMDISVIEKKGYEADDIIGTLSTEASNEGINTFILTGDRDSFQLVKDNVSVLYPASRSGYQFFDINEDYIEKEYGVTPEELKTVKALMGDKSDNIPGIAGVGEKTALKLVKQYHTLEDLYEHTDDLKGKLKERIVNGEKDAYDSLYLGTIVCDVPLNEPLDDLKFKGLLTPESEAIMHELGFRSILSRLDEGEAGENTQTKQNLNSISSVEITSKNELQGLLGRINSRKSYNINYFQYNTAKNDPYNAPDSGGDIYFAIEVGNFYYFIKNQELIKAFCRGIIGVPNADEIQAYGHNFKNLEKIFNRYNATITNLTFDLYIASYLNDPSLGQYDLSSIASRWLDVDYPSEVDLFGKGRSLKTVEEVGEDKFRNWLVQGVDLIKKIYPFLREKIEQDGMLGLYEDIEVKLEPVLAEMEEYGFKVDLEMLKGLSVKFEENLNTLESEIYELAGSKFNIGSPKQLGKVLFEDLKLPVIKKTKTGYSTSAEVLEELKVHHPIVEKILEWRKINKLDSTYGKGLIGFVDPETDKIYSTFNQTVTTTGRISSADPNLQNIPVKTEMGREIRKVFIASAPDRVLVDADYSQIELRVLASLSGDETLINAFKEGRDVHADTAAKVFHEELNEVNSSQRRYAKMINFGLIYGKQAFTLAKDLGVSRNEAQDFIDTYFHTYPKIKNYLESSINSAREKGYSQTIFGRRRYIPEINSKNRVVAQSGERMAQNMPIQGAAADIIKKAMIDVSEALEKEKLDAHLILQVHDELIIDSSKEDSKRVEKLLVEKMENAVKLDVPLSVEAKTGYSWYEAK